MPAGGGPAGFSTPLSRTPVVRMPAGSAPGAGLSTPPASAGQYGTPAYVNAQPQATSMANYGGFAQAQQQLASGGPRPMKKGGAVKKAKHSKGGSVGDTKPRHKSGGSFK